METYDYIVLFLLISAFWNGVQAQASIRSLRNEVRQQAQRIEFLEKELVR